MVPCFAFRSGPLQLLVQALLQLHQSVHICLVLKYTLNPCLPPWASPRCRRRDCAQQTARAWLRTCAPGTLLTSRVGTSSRRCGSRRWGCTGPAAMGTAVRSSTPCAKGHFHALSEGLEWQVGRAASLLGPSRVLQALPGQGSFSGRLCCTPVGPGCLALRFATRCLALTGHSAHSIARHGARPGRLLTSVSGVGPVKSGTL
jgi:hypothetical protein